MVNKIMQNDFSLRIKVNPEEILSYLPGGVEPKKLPIVKDYMYKPEGRELHDYRPDQVCVRLREFSGVEKPSVLAEITTTKGVTGYSDSKNELATGTTSALKRKAEELGYESWGELTYNSVEYGLLLANEQTATLLLQDIIPIGSFIKIEANSEEDLNNALKMLRLEDSERIEKNAAVILAEDMNLL